MKCVARSKVPTSSETDADGGHSSYRHNQHAAARGHRFILVLPLFFFNQAGSLLQGTLLHYGSRKGSPSESIVLYASSFVVNWHSANHSGAVFLMLASSVYLLLKNNRAHTEYASLVVMFLNKLQIREEQL